MREGNKCDDFLAAQDHVDLDQFLNRERTIIQVQETMEIIYTPKNDLKFQDTISTKIIINFSYISYFQQAIS